MQCRVEEAAEKVPEHQVLPQVDAEISAMEHQEKAYETQVTCGFISRLIFYVYDFMPCSFALCFEFFCIRVPAVETKVSFTGFCAR